MTLIVAVTSPESIWMLADRRLSSPGHSPNDDARKIMFLETTDGVAILGYAGLGATAQGTEPADWMSRVLRTRNIQLEHALGILAQSAKQELPRHLALLQTGHTIVVPAFLGDEARLYTIDVGSKPGQFLWTRRVAGAPGKERTPRIGVTGSGAVALKPEKGWQRLLLRLVKAHDRGVVRPFGVADYLASLNHKVHLATLDGTVGPKCVVAWRFRRSGRLGGGGGQQFYIGADRDRSSSLLPTIAHGMDVHALVKIMLSHAMPRMMTMRDDEPQPDIDVKAINAELATLPDKPDETLF